MSRWIDADALIEHITNTADLGGWIGEALQQIKQVAIKYINLAPSIDIVRCRECKYSGVRNDADVECKKHKLIMRLRDFCSYGEVPGISTGSVDTQTYITEDEGTRILDAWQVKHMQDGKE